jgi:hypothetical protein
MVSYVYSKLQCHIKNMFVMISCVGVLLLSSDGVGFFELCAVLASDSSPAT